MMSLLKQIKPCKKCGYVHARHIRYKHDGFGHYTHRISCPFCGYCTNEKDSLEEACNAWNTPCATNNKSLKKEMCIMKIYMVELHDYDRDESVGYFTDRKKAESCRDYLNITDRSQYNDDGGWYVVEFDLNETDYDALNKEIEERERIEFETRMEREKQEELAKLEELKAKYETPKVAKWTLHSDGSGTCSHCHFTQRGVYDQDNFNRFCSVCGYEMTI